MRDMIIVPVYINSKGPFNFVLDTGVGFMLITDPKLVDSIDLVTRRTVKIFGSGNAESFEAYTTSEIDVKVGNAIKSTMVNAAILKEDHFGLSNYTGMPIHGLLGYEFFSELSVKINFIDSTLVVARSGMLKPFKKGIIVPLNIEDRKPYLNTAIMLPDSCLAENKFIIDLGAGHPLSLEKLQGNRDVSRKIVAANLGVGITGPINGYISRIKQLTIGKYRFYDVITSFPDTNASSKFFVARDGNIGLGILKRFYLILDYKNGLMYMKPNYRLKEPFEHDMSGIEYYAAGPDLKRILISRVEPGSAADEAGLTADDEITAVNFKNVDRMSIVDIDNLFKSQHNRNVLVEIYRDKKFETVILTLKRRI